MWQLDGRQRLLELTVAPHPDAGPRTPPAVAVVLHLIAAMGLLFGVVVGMKRAESKACRALTLFFFLSVTRCIPEMSGSISVLLRYSGTVTIPMLFGAVMFFAVYFPSDEPRGWRASIARARYFIAAVLVLYAVLQYMLIVLHRAAPALSAGLLVALLATGVVASSLFEGWRTSQGEARQRQLWLLSSFSVIMLAVFATYLVPNTPGQVYYAITYYVGLVGLAGLAYSALRYRVLDFSFAVNRALVYTLTSIVLLIAFGITEWLAIHFLHFESRKSNALLDGGIALAVYLTFHKVRHFIEHHMEKMLFHKWHQNEAALRAFVKRAAHFVNRDALLVQFGKELDRFSGGAGHAIYQRERTDNCFVLVGQSELDVPERLDPDEDIAVWLRDDSAPALMRDTGSTLAGELVLPMAHRSVLDGFIILGAKANLESYRPDELEVLAFAAHQIGLDLHAVRVEQLEQYVEEAKLEARWASRQREEALGFEPGRLATALPG